MLGFAVRRAIEGRGLFVVGKLVIASKFNGLGLVFNNCWENIL